MADWISDELDELIEVYEHCKLNEGSCSNGIYDKCAFYDKCHKDIYSSGALDRAVYDMLKEFKDRIERNITIICPHCGRRVK